MSALAVQHEQPVESGENHWLQWFRVRQEEQARPPLVLLESMRDGRTGLADLNNGDPPPLMLWGEE